MNQSQDQLQNDETIEPANMRMGAGIVFVRRTSNVIIGHVGWGFMLPSDDLSSGQSAASKIDRMWNIGAVENPSGWLFANPGSDGFWKQHTAAPLPIMINLGYDHYKVIPVAAPLVQKAEATEEGIRTREYSVTLINCMNDVYDILTAYGLMDLPNPQSIPNWMPNAWFDHINAPQFAIDDATGLNEF